MHDQVPRELADALEKEKRKVVKSRPTINFAKEHNPTRHGTSKSIREMAEDCVIEAALHRTFAHTVQRERRSW